MHIDLTYGPLSYDFRMPPDSYYISLQIYKKWKTWESVSVARPTHQALALPFLSGRTTKKPTPIILYSSSVFLLKEKQKKEYNIPMSIYRCYVSLTGILNLRDSDASKNKAHDKRLPHMS